MVARAASWKSLSCAIQASVRKAVQQYRNQRIKIKEGKGHTMRRGEVTKVQVGLAKNNKKKNRVIASQYSETKKMVGAFKKVRV